MKVSDESFLLSSGQDIPYISAQLQIHQPRLKDIAVIGENDFFAGVGLINFDKDILKLEDNFALEKLSNFEIIMMMMQNPNPETQMMKIKMQMVLAILFPEYNIDIQQKKIMLTKFDTENESNPFKEINDSNFDELRLLLNKILCLSNRTGEERFNPQSKMAKRIADKLQKGRQKAAKSKGENETSLLARYVSILCVGEQKDINSLMNYTLYQLFEEYKRYSAKLSFDMNLQARLAGAKDLEAPKSWMDDLDE